ncbi:retrovirus-related pol polyprotein from transposon TNT 1-94 [Tanacetum coccineum]
MEEEGERYFTPCYVGGLHAHDGEINFKYEKNLISNKFAVKLCLEYKETNGERLVKRELLVSIKGEFYFVKFIINPEEDDVEPSIENKEQWEGPEFQDTASSWQEIEAKVFTFYRMEEEENNQGSVAEGIENKEQWEGPEFQDTTSGGQEIEAKVFTFYRMEEEGERYFTPCYVGGLHAYDGEINLKYEKNLISNEFAVKLCLEYEEKNREKLVKRELLVSLKGEFYFVKFIVNPEEDDVEPNVVLGRSFMRLAKGIADFGNGVITIHPELDPLLDNSEETEKFEDDWDHLHDIDFGDIPEIDEAGLPPFVCKIGKIKGEALNEKEDPGAFIISIRLEAKINLNALADTGSDIDVMPYQIYAKLGREEVKKVNRGITMLNHLKAEPMGVLKDILCQVGVTTIIVKFLILDMPIDRHAPILVGRGFLYTCGSILNTRDRITSTFDGIYHQTFRAAKTSLNTEESDNDDEEDYGIQRNSFGAPMYGPKPAKYLNCNDPMDQALALQEVLNPLR